MIIRFHRTFDKRYEKASPILQKKIDQAIRRFAQNPRSARLRDHALVGVLIGKRAFSVTGNLRMIYEMEGTYAVVLMLDVGTHAQVYE